MTSAHVAASLAATSWAVTPAAAHLASAAMTALPMAVDPVAAASPLFAGRFSLSCFPVAAASVLATPVAAFSSITITK